MRSLKDFEFDGRTVLRTVVEASEYRNIPQAIAALTLFNHPATIEQTRSMNLFKVIRCRLMSDRGKYRTQEDDSCVMLDDNTAPTEAFIWANGMSRRAYKDIQFNHVWSVNDVSLYTSLANICVTPAFLAKLTDTDEYVRDLLRYRACELFQGFAPTGTRPTKPYGYDNLIWAETLPPISDLEQKLRREMARKRSNRTVRSAKELGWLFSSFEPDMNL